MRVVLITAGAGRMYCSSCIRDGHLARGLRALGHEPHVVAVYTPPRTDGPRTDGPRTDGLGHQGERVFLPGPRVFVRHALGWSPPELLLRPFGNIRVIELLTRLSGGADYAELGALACDVLAGRHLEPEIDELVDHVRPLRADLVLLSTPLLGALGLPLREATGAPVLATLQGDDRFVEALGEPHRSDARRLLLERCRELDGLIAVSRSHRADVRRWLADPSLGVAVVHGGVDPAAYVAASRARRPSASPTVGFLSRITRDKGLHLVGEACRRAKLPLSVAGYLAPSDRAYLSRCPHERYLGELDLEAKARFLASVDIVCLAPTYSQAFGTCAIEALAAGTPCVAPAHGAFVELAEETGGIVLFEPNDIQAMAEALVGLADHPERRAALGIAGQRAATARFSHTAMAERLIDVARTAWIR